MSINIGEYTYGHEHIHKHFPEASNLNIGKFCSIAGDVTVFLGGNHRTDWITTFPFNLKNTSEFGAENITGHPKTKGDVNIGNDVWIGQHVVIMSGVTIGDGSVIAANSHVVKNVEPYSIVGGNPANLLKYRFEKDIIDLLMELKWWDLPKENIKEIINDLCSQPNKDKLIELVQKYRRG